MSTELDSLNSANSSTLAAHFQRLGLGTLLAGHLPQQLVSQDPAAATNELATLEGVGLPYYSRAAFITRATAKVSGNSVTGELVVKLFGVTPSTGEIAVSPSGDIVVLAADQITSLDVHYLPVAGEVVEWTGPVATGILTLPDWIVDRKPLMLLEAELLAGTVTGRKIVLVPAAAVVATTKAAIAVDRTKVYFNHSTDAGTKARVKLLVAPLVGLADNLAAAPKTV